MTNLFPDLDEEGYGVGGKCEVYGCRRKAIGRNDDGRALCDDHLTMGRDPRSDEAGKWQTQTRTLANDLREEADQLRRRFVHHTRPQRPLTLQEAIDLCRQMTGEPR